MSEEKIRASIFAWLDERSKKNGGVFSRDELANDFKYNNNKIPLVGPTGIWKPKDFKFPISISTTSNSPYQDTFTDNGFIHYSYRGKDPKHRDNVGLRSAFNENIPLIYFHSIKQGNIQQSIRYLFSMTILIIFLSKQLFILILISLKKMK